MTELATGSNAYEAWRAGSRALLAQSRGEIPCIVTTIADASVERQDWYSTYDARKPKDFDKLKTVVQVLAPSALLDHSIRRTDRYQRAWDMFDRLRARGIKVSGWRDTYFERLTRINQSNRLEDLVDALIRWNQNVASALYAHIDGGDEQSLRTRGSPCLQYVQFNVDNGVVNLTGLYRAHDFERKALGNFIGLTRLVRFMAKETGRNVGTVRCVSLHAHCTNKSNLTKLVA
jgi:hypothetical protein